MPSQEKKLMKEKQKKRKQTSVYHAQKKEIWKGYQTVKYNQMNIK
jgi:hypothetical protein